MKKFIQLNLFLLFTCSSLFVKADEGMWFPQLLQQMNAAEMRLKGLEIPVEEIYNVNKGSIKDAVVLFGAGCTGEVVSSQGLLLTNHHCGFSQIQSQSSVEHNYIKDGFWAKNYSDEIPCPGLTVTFIISITDVTAEVNKFLTDDMPEKDRNANILQVTQVMAKELSAKSGYDVNIKQFFSGNEFYAIASQTFKDIRMVGAPPTSIGRFGGDTDNWMWPSHSGDFSMFRIYAGKNNEPAAYDSTNVPYKSKFSLSINLNGVNQDEFTMVYGFPGTTKEYISSYAIELTMNVFDPNRIKVRDERLRILSDAMKSSEVIHIKYAAKHNTLSNPWKKWRGEMRGLQQANALQKKRDFENDFQAWTQKDPSRKIKYGSLLSSFEKIYTDNRPYQYANDFYAEAVLGIELINYCNGFHSLSELAFADSTDWKKVKEEADKLKAGVDGYFKNYDAATDQLVMASLLKVFDQEVNDSLKPAYFTDLRKRYNSDFNKIAEDIFSKTIFTSQEKTTKLFSKFDRKAARRLKEDPAFIFTDNLTDFYKKRITEKTNYLTRETNRLNRFYLAAQREMQPDKKFYPDANLTLRLTFGQARGYAPRDGVYYEFRTTLDGLMQKYIPGDEEFDVPQKLIDLYKAKDYGRYALNGTIPVSFIATNHTTGGNSGSPVLNGKGQLVGINYDRVWEGTMSDLYYNPDICRNMTLDIRYVLFIIDKYAGAQRLIDEMDIIQ